MDMKAWLHEQLTADKRRALPILSFPSIQLLGITVRELISDSDLQARGMCEVAKRCPAAAAVSMMDLSVEAECFGSQIRVSDDEVPTVVGSVVNSMEDAQALKVPQVGAGRTGVYVEAISKALKLITDRPVFAGVIGPYSLAGRLMDMTQIMMNCYDEPEMVHATLEKTTDFILAYIQAYKDVGAHGVVIAEPAAGLLSPDLCEEFSSPYVKKIVDAVQDDQFLVIYHNCGNAAARMVPQLLEIGASGYHFGNHGQPGPGVRLPQRHARAGPDGHAGASETLHPPQELPDLLRMRHPARLLLGEHRRVLRGGGGILSMTPRPGGGCTASRPLYKENGHDCMEPAHRGGGGPGGLQGRGDPGLRRIL